MSMVMSMVMAAKAMSMVITSSKLALVGLVVLRTLQQHNEGSSSHLVGHDSSGVQGGASLVRNSVPVISSAGVSTCVVGVSSASRGILSGSCATAGRQPELVSSLTKNRGRFGENWETRKLLTLTI